MPKLLLDLIREDKSIDEEGLFIRESIKTLSVWLQENSFGVDGVERRSVNVGSSDGGEPGRPSNIKPIVIVVTVI